ncbi:platelet glycoprotein Ib alpha chain [Ictalurus furcatus]|uniref:platelet glycoprotein Ib alpha chain n=1 Tax=Ictalurus furcatus TaxID=66913 RepID=UPI002350ABD4|nr:platelet glycoprotein Ib alpha chain [Ictalurus furcatus]
MLLILFLLVSQHSMVTTISSCHSDRDKDHRPRVSCVSQGLSTVPDGIDLETQTLVLAQNAFVSLSWAIYTTFTHLHELDLSQNLISTIDQSGPVLQNLRVLRLSNNKLTGLSGAAFKSTPSLMEVYLDGNTISSLDSTTFSDLPLLELINLSCNKLQILPPHLLEQISSSNLKKFDVEENLLQHLPDKFFASKYELPYVFLSKNLWVCTCQVSYLQRYLNDQGHDVYNHTGPSSIENAPESVVCSAPPTLQGRAIVDLTEDEYCISYTDSQHSTAHTTQRTSAPTTALTTAIIQQKVITTAILATPSVTIQPTTPKTVETSSTPTPTTLTANNPTTITITTTKPTIPTDNMGTTMTPGSTTVQPTTPTATEPTTSSTPTTTESTTTSSTPTTTEPTTTSSTPTTTEPTTTSSTTQTTVQPTTPKNAPIPTTLTTNNPTTIKSVTMVTYTAGGILSGHGGGQRSVSWCWWLFITVLLLCIFSAIFSCMLFLWLIIIYITLYKPIKRQVHSSQGVTLRAYQVTADESLTADRTEEERVLFLPPEMIQETQPVFRSVPFISKGDEDGEVDERRDGTRNEDEEKKRGTDAVAKIDCCRQ